MAPGPCGKPRGAAHETAGELRVRPCLAPQSCWRRTPRGARPSYLEWRTRLQPAAVVATELVSVCGVGVPALVVLRRVLDLVLRAVDEDGLGVRIDVADRAGGDHHLLAENPRAGVDDDERTADLVARFVDLADTTVAGFDLVAGQVVPRPRRFAVHPDAGSGSRHVRLLSSDTRVLTRSAGPKHAVLEI